MTKSDTISSMVKVKLSHYCLLQVWNVAEWEGWCGFAIPSPRCGWICFLDHRKDLSNRCFCAWLLLGVGYLEAEEQTSRRAEGSFSIFIPWTLFPLGHRGLCHMSFQVAYSVQLSPWSLACSSQPGNVFSKLYLHLCKQYLEETTQVTQSKFHVFPAKIRTRL